MAAIGCNDCVFKFFDVPLVTEWSKTIGEWAEFLKNPFKAVRPVDLIKVDHGGDDGASAWSALSLFGGIGFAILAFILNIALWDMIVEETTSSVVEGAGGSAAASAAASAVAGATSMPVGNFIMNFISQLICVLILANVGWFSIVKRPSVAKAEGDTPESLPCCCFVIGCVSCKCVPLAWAITVWLLAAVWVIERLSHLGKCGACFLFILPPLVYCFFLVYFGISAFKIWKEVFKGEKPNIVGPAVSAGDGEAQTNGAPTLIGQATADAKEPEKVITTPAEKETVVEKEVEAV